MIEQKIGYNSLAAQVYDLLWKRIIEQKILPGEKLSDVQLSKDLGTSRTPVREALYRLVQEGIVQNQALRGFYLTTFSSQDVKEIYDLRMALEVLAVRLALPNLTQRDLDKAQVDLDEAKQLLDANDERGQQRLLDIDREFHQLLVRSSKNGRLASNLESLHAQIKVFQLYGSHLKEIVNSSFEQHQAIVAALVSRDEKAAIKAMERHIQEVKAHVLADFVSVTR
ncbi:MAG: transcriptional regulator, GntR family [Chloroflexi bacterium]|jgi:DNA-binding GntR family transcriptional regulator|nr:transcriptional regulator, GntR family [Chloroflexota bacterium]